MFTISAPLSAEMAAMYFQEEYARASYYTEGAKLKGHWGGKLAEAKGLYGEIKPDDWNHLLRGRDLDGNIQVQQHTVAGEAKHRAAWDAHFSLSKSLSIAALIYGDNRLIEAHEQTVKECMADLERFTQVRQHGGKERVTTGNLAYGMFTHYYARPAEGQDVPDPQLHTHVPFMNMSNRGDKIVALEPRELYRSQTWIQSVYQSRMAERTTALGYRIEFTGPGQWEIKGDGKAFSKEHLEHWSKRSQEIKTDLNGLKEADPENAKKYEGSKAKNYAAHRSRQAKRLDFEHRELVEAWKKEDRQNGFDYAQQIISQAKERTGGQQLPSLDERAATARAAVAYSMKHNSEREAVFCERAMEEHAANCARDKATIADIRAAIKEELRSAELIAAIRHEHPNKAYTTREMLRLEQENIAWTTEGVGRQQPISWRPELKGLDSDQQRVAAFALASRDRFIMIEGRAGTGKSHTLSAIKDEAERSGWQVRVLTPTTKPARDFRTAGIEAHTIDSFLCKNEQQLNEKPTVYFIDELGLASTAKFHQVKDKLQSKDRMIGVGDSRQNKPIAAGQPMAYLPAARESLDKIHRQKDPQLKEAAQLFSEGKMRQGLQTLEEKTEKAPAGRIHEFKTDQERRSWVADAYVKTPNGSLVITATRLEAKEINGMVRDRLKETGAVSRDEMKTTILVSRDVSGPQRELAANYRERDIVYYRAGSKAAGIEKGSYGEVRSVHTESNTVTVGINGKDISYNPRRLKGVEVYTKEERSFAAGDRIQTSRAINSQGIANGDFGTITGIDRNTRTAAVRFDDGHHRNIRLADAHIEHGYATTNAKAQGSTLRSGFLSIDGKHAGQENIYVSATRFQEDFQIAVSDKARLYLNAERSQKKTHATESLMETTKGVGAELTKDLPKSIGNAPGKGIEFSF